MQGQGQRRGQKGHLQGQLAGAGAETEAGRGTYAEPETRADEVANTSIGAGAQPRSAPRVADGRAETSIGARAVAGPKGGQ